MESFILTLNNTTLKRVVAVFIISAVVGALAGICLLQSLKLYLQLLLVVDLFNVIPFFIMLQVKKLLNFNVPRIVLQA